jgi:hypothetical protein
MKIYMVRALRAPDLSFLANRFQNQLCNSDRRLTQLGGFDLACLPDVVAMLEADEYRTSLIPLRHELSDLVIAPKKPALNNEGLHGSRSEVAILKQFERQITTALRADLNSLISVLTDLNSCLRNMPVTLREGRVYTTKDEKGSYWQYPDACCILPIFDDIFRLLRNARTGDALLRATVILALFNCAHPFSDGNGRISRILFNYTLAKSGKVRDSVYIPCSEIFSLSHHGYLIRIRDLSLRNNWEDFIGFFCAVIEVYALMEKLQSHGEFNVN